MGHNVLDQELIPYHYSQLVVIVRATFLKKT